MNAECIVVDKPIAGLTGISFNKCTTLDQVLAALAACCDTAADAKQDNHPATPIATVADLGAAQPLLTNGLFETEDTNEIILGFGADGRLRARRRLYATHLRFSGLSAPIAPNTQLTVPFNSLVFNHGGAGSLGSAAHWTAPFPCVVAVSGYIFFSYEAWTGSTPGATAGANAAIALLFKNGAPYEQLGTDYNFKGGAVTPVAASGANEFKAPNGSVLVECATGDVLTIRAGNGKSAGTSHTFFYAYGSFHVVGAI